MRVHEIHSIVGSLTLLLCMLIVVVVVNGKCPEEQKNCKCENSTVICSCSDETSFIGTKFPPDTRSLEISNCNEVSFCHQPFLHLNLEMLIIRNVAKLEFDHMTFMGLEKVTRIRLANIANLIIKSLYSLRATSFELNNVTIEALERHAVPGLALIGNVRISNSHIKLLKNGSVHFRNNSLEIIDSQLDFIEGSALTLQNVKNFTLSRCFLSLDEDALNFINVSKITFDNNVVSATSVGSFLIYNVGEFVVKQNVFSSVGSDTFYHLQKVGKLLIQSNRFVNVETNGILLNRWIKGPFFKNYCPIVKAVPTQTNVTLQGVVEQPELIIDDNEFKCDCDLFWLWLEKGYIDRFDKFLNTSKCFSPDSVSDLPLSAVMPFTDRTTDQCIRFEPLAHKLKIEPNPIITLEHSKQSSCSTDIKQKSAWSIMLTLVLLHAALLCQMSRFALPQQ